MIAGFGGVTATSVRLTLPGNLREREGGPAPLTDWAAVVWTA